MRWNFIESDNPQLFDDEYELIGTNITIQDCTNYTGFYSVNLHGDDWVQTVAYAKTLNEAKRKAINYKLEN